MLNFFFLCVFFGIEKTNYCIFKKGIRTAALERVKFELNIELKEESDFLLLDKILYASPFDDTWGEKERKPH